jgi:hypothetical protein
LHNQFLLELTWELWCKIVEPKNHTPYETWAENLFAHIAKAWRFKILYGKEKNKITRHTMSKSLNTNHLDIFRGISIHYDELKTAIYFSLESYNNNSN